MLVRESRPSRAAISQFRRDMMRSRPYRSRHAALESTSMTRTSSGRYRTRSRCDGSRDCLRGTSSNWKVRSYPNAPYLRQNAYLLLTD